MGRGGAPQWGRAGLPGGDWTSNTRDSHTSRNITLLYCYVDKVLLGSSKSLIYNDQRRRCTRYTLSRLIKVWGFCGTLERFKSLTSHQKNRNYLTRHLHAAVWSLLLLLLKNPQHGTDEAITIISGLTTTFLPLKAFCREIDEANLINMTRDRELWKFNHQDKEEWF